jgi:hypothetical protein
MSCGCKKGYKKILQLAKKTAIAQKDTFVIYKAEDYNFIRKIFAEKYGYKIITTINEKGEII